METMPRSGPGPRPADAPRLDRSRWSSPLFADLGVVARQGVCAAGGAEQVGRGGHQCECVPAPAVGIGDRAHRVAATATSLASRVRVPAHTTIQPAAPSRTVAVSRVSHPVDAASIDRAVPPTATVTPSPVPEAWQWKQVVGEDRPEERCVDEAAGEFFGNDGDLDTRCPVRTAASATPSVRVRCPACRGDRPSRGGHRSGPRSVAGGVAQLRLLAGQPCVHRSPNTDLEV